MTPYYSDSWTTIYHGDCREVLPDIGPGQAQAIITDPVWPGAAPRLTGSEDPQGLFARAAAYFHGICDRLVVVLGCDSDPRFLVSVPPELPFVRLCWLRRIPPTYKGPILFGAEVAYVFGAAWLPGDGSRVLPGEMVYASKGANGKREAQAGGSTHPCARNLIAMRWLVGNYSRPGHTVLDPFCGEGSTLLAARETGRRSIGIEIEEQYCEVAARKCAQAVMDLGPGPCNNAAVSGALWGMK